MKKPVYKYPLIEVQWTDAETGHGWEEESDLDIALPLVTTVGFLVRESETCVMLASTISDSSSNARIKIPRGMITNTKILK